MQRVGAVPRIQRRSYGTLLFLTATVLGLALGGCSGHGSNSHTLSSEEQAQNAAEGIVRALYDGNAELASSPYLTVAQTVIYDFRKTIVPGLGTTKLSAVDSTSWSGQPHNFIDVAVRYHTIGDGPVCEIEIAFLATGATYYAVQKFGVAGNCLIAAGEYIDTSG